MKDTQTHNVVLSGQMDRYIGNKNKREKNDIEDEKEKQTIPYNHHMHNPVNGVSF